MKLDKVLAITGKPGLFHLESQTRTGFLATSLLDGKRITVGVRNNVSLLSEIAIYTLEKEIPLSEVFQAIKNKENGEELQFHIKTVKMFWRSIFLKYFLITMKIKYMSAT